MSGSENPEIQDSSGGQLRKKGQRVGRRTVIKAGVATAAGLALANSYVKPGVVSVGVRESYAVSLGGSAAGGDQGSNQGSNQGGDQGGDQGGNKH